MEITRPVTRGCLASPTHTMDITSAPHPLSPGAAPTDVYSAHCSHSYYLEWLTVVRFTLLTM